MALGVYSQFWNQGTITQTLLSPLYISSQYAFINIDHDPNYSPPMPLRRHVSGSHLPLIFNPLYGLFRSIEKTPSATWKNAFATSGLLQGIGELCWLPMMGSKMLVEWVVSQVCHRPLSSTVLSADVVNDTCSFIGKQLHAALIYPIHWIRPAIIARMDSGQYTSELQ